MLARLTKCSGGIKGERFSSAYFSFFPGDSLSALIFCQEAQYTILHKGIARIFYYPLYPAGAASARVPAPIIIVICRCGRATLFQVRGPCTTPAGT